MRRLVGLALAVCALTVLPPTVVAREPRLTVSPSKLRSSLFCQESINNASRAPVLLVTGTGVDGSEAWPNGLQLSLVRAGVPSCYMNFPQHTTGDIQIAVQYLVHAIRSVRQRARRDFAV
jgi:triacylglycerol lipase